MNIDNTQPQQPEFSFSGFDLSRYTPIPDQFFDELLPILSGSESKVLSYIFRRTLGFQKTADDISLNQMLHGITTKDGRQLDHGVGLARSTLIRAINQLVDKNIIIVEKSWNPNGGSGITSYSLNISQHTNPSDNISHHNIVEPEVISRSNSEFINGGESRIFQEGVRQLSASDSSIDPFLEDDSIHSLSILDRPKSNAPDIQIRQIWYNDSSKLETFVYKNKKDS